MKLYYSPLSPYSQKVLMACYEKGIEFEPEVVNIMDPEAKAKYTKDVNPIGRVPFLKLDDGWMIPESSIIIEYLDTHFDSGPQLISDDKDKARQARFHDRIGDLYLIDPAGNLFFENMKREDQRNQENVARWKDTIKLMLGYLNETLGKQKFVLGDELSFADLSAISGSALSKFVGVELPENVEKWIGGIFQRESWQKIMKEAEPMMGKM